ncbi:hypothetical protein LCGC14_1275630 [marine sediment metagenome]|uniref:Uncharacterized protein n=1 Tax=marine sediment metagenome TaxID=412755 RepID=A0A0F9NDH5_9ZZZZ
MANGTTPQAPTSGLNLEKIKQAVSTQAQQTAQVVGPQTLNIPSAESMKIQPFGWRNIYTGETSGREREVGAGWYNYRKPASELAIETSQKAAGIRIEGAKQSFATQTEAMQKQATKSAEALSIMGESTTEYIRQLDEVKNQATAAVTSSSDAWNAATEKADEYVQSARARVGDALTKLDELNQQIGERRDFAKAHDMQVAVQSVLGQMNSEGRGIAERYGVDSAEYQQFQQSKRATLATVQSNIHANYQKIQEQQNLTYMSATNESLWKHNMYTSYQEQQHVDTLRYMAQAEDQYSLQLSNFNTTIEQLKMSGLENLANWMVSTPVYSVDTLDLMNYVADSYVSL